jgi:hypothetical protein
MNLDKLRVLFPRCNFDRSGTHHNIVYITFKLYNIEFNSFGTLSENNFKYIYDSIDYVLQFLKKHNFTFQEACGNIISSFKNNIIVYFTKYDYYVEISGDRFQVNADELIIMIKKELDIQTSYKPVLE